MYKRRGLRKTIKRLKQLLKASLQLIVIFAPTSHVSMKTRSSIRHRRYITHNPFHTLYNIILPTESWI